MSDDRELAYCESALCCFKCGEKLWIVDGNSCKVLGHYVLDGKNYCPECWERTKGRAWRA